MQNLYMLLKRLNSWLLLRVMSLLMQKDGGLTPVAKLLGAGIQGKITNAYFVKKWFQENGDYRHRLNYDGLIAESLVFDLGGFKGQFASDLYAKYNSKVFVFEPVTTFYEFIRDRFHCNSNLTVFPFGLGERDYSLPIYLSGDSSSGYRKSGEEFELVRIVSFQNFLGNHAINAIDLMKVNIEGAEYDLLDHLIENGIHLRIKNLQIQFHRAVPNYKARYMRIAKELEKSHRLTYHYPFLWENWSLTDLN
jgi:FkbM family methyltransferase